MDRNQPLPQYDRLRASYNDARLSDRNFSRPLINSALNTNTSADTLIARQQQDYPLSNFSMDVNEYMMEDVSSFDPKRLEEIDRDAAYAAQLQKEEYSRDSLTPPRLHKRQLKTNPFQSIAIASNNSLVISDAEYAAHLQAEEEQNQRGNRFRQAFPSQRRAPHSSNNLNLHSNDSEIIPIPNHIRSVQQRPSSDRNSQRNAHNVAQMLGRRYRPNADAQPGLLNIANNDQDFGPNDYETLVELDNSVGRKPLSKGQINEFPTEKYRRIPNRNDENDKCSICMEDYEQDQILRRLPCIHVYHKDCIDKWLKQGNLCPVCRVAVSK